MQAEVEFEIGLYCVPVFHYVLSAGGELLQGFLFGLGLVLVPVLRLVLW